MKEKPLSPRKKITIAVILLAVLAELIAGFIFWCFSIQGNTCYSEMTYYWSQIISSFFVISGVVVAGWEYYLSSRISRTNLNIIQVQKAIDLAEYYKDNILTLYPAIRYVFDESGISEILKTIKTSDMQDFDKDELTGLLSEDQISTLKKLQKSEEFTDAVLKADIIYNLNLSDNHLLLLAGYTKDKINFKEIHDLKMKTITLAFMMDYIQTILNNLEFFAMHFKHNTANESVIYQSLHQSYLEIVEALYYFISKTNADDTGKYYTNIIWLYTQWSNFKKQKKGEQKAFSRTTVTHGMVIEEE